MRDAATGRREDPAGARVGRCRALRRGRDDPAMPGSRLDRGRAGGLRTVRGQSPCAADLVFPVVNDPLVAAAEWNPQSRAPGSAMGGARRRRTAAQRALADCGGGSPHATPRALRRPAAAAAHARGPAGSAPPRRRCRGPRAPHAGCRRARTPRRRRAAPRGSRSGSGLPAAAPRPVASRRPGAARRPRGGRARPARRPYVRRRGVELQAPLAVVAHRSPRGPRTRARGRMRGSARCPSQIGRGLDLQRRRAAALAVRWVARAVAEGRPGGVARRWSVSR